MEPKTGNKKKRTQTTNLILVNSVFKVHFDKEIHAVKETDFTRLTGKKKEAFVKDMNKVKELITEGYCSAIDFISYSLKVVK